MMRVRRRASCVAAGRPDGARAPQWHLYWQTSNNQGPQRQTRGIHEAHHRGLVLAAIAVTAWSAESGADWRQKVDPWVLDTASGGRTTEFLVYLREQADLRDAASASRPRRRAAGSPTSA